jgi:hypothetical protein
MASGVTQTVNQAPTQTVQQGPIHQSCNCGAQSTPAPPDRRVNVIGAIGALMAALVAGTFALLGLVISKENKISEFRQAWIDAVRKDIADYTAAVKGLANYQAIKERPGNAKNKLEYEKLLQPIYRDAVAAQMSIRARLNKDDSNADLKTLNVSLLTRLDEVQALMNESKHDAASKLLVDLHNVVNPLLKHEWERVKKGERTYVLARNGAWILIGVSLLATIVAFVVLASSG